MSKKVLNDEFLNEPVIGAPDLGDVRQIPMPKTPTEAFLSTPKVETATPAVIDSRFEPKREAKTSRVVPADWFRNLMPGFVSRFCRPIDRNYRSCCAG